MDFEVIDDADTEDDGDRNIANWVSWNLNSSDFGSAPRADADALPFDGPVIDIKYHGVHEPPEFDGMTTTDTLILLSY